VTDRGCLGKYTQAHISKEDPAENERGWGTGIKTYFAVRRRSQTPDVEGAKAKCEQGQSSKHGVMRDGIGELEQQPARRVAGQRHGKGDSEPGGD